MINSNRVAMARNLPHDVRTDEAGTADDKHWHNS
jgi:hypothetical protein